MARLANHGLQVAALHGYRDVLEWLVDDFKKHRPLSYNADHLPHLEPLLAGRTPDVIAHAVDVPIDAKPEDLETAIGRCLQHTLLFEGGALFDQLVDRVTANPTAPALLTLARMLALLTQVIGLRLVGVPPCVVPNRVSP